MEVRKIVSKEVLEKKRKRNQIIIGIVLVGLMVLSTIGYSFMSQDNPTTGTQTKITYNGFEFVNSGGLWQLAIGNLFFYFTYTPNEIESINTSGLNLISSYSGKVLYVSSESPEAELEIYRNLDQIIFRRQYACLEEECTNPDYPIKTCDEYFIIIREANENSITQDRNCVYIEGKKEDLGKVADEFILRILNVR